jgi:hypothetical protein
MPQCAEQTIISGQATVRPSTIKQIARRVMVEGYRSKEFQDRNLTTILINKCSLTLLRAVPAKTIA